MDEAMDFINLCIILENKFMGLKNNYINIHKQLIQSRQENKKIKIDFEKTKRVVYKYKTTVDQNKLENVSKMNKIYNENVSLKRKIIHLEILWKNKQNILQNKIKQLQSSKLEVSKENDKKKEVKLINNQRHNQKFLKRKFNKSENTINGKRKMFRIIKIRFRRK